MVRRTGRRRGQGRRCAAGPRDPRPRRSRRSRSPQTRRAEQDACVRFLAVDSVPGQHKEVPDIPSHQGPPLCCRVTELLSVGKLHVSRLISWALTVDSVERAALELPVRVRIRKSSSRPGSFRLTEPPSRVLYTFAGEYPQPPRGFGRYSSWEQEYGCHRLTAASNMRPDRPKDLEAAAARRH
jgi:hypothetical protein